MTQALPVTRVSKKKKEGEQILGSQSCTCKKLDLVVHGSRSGSLPLKQICPACDTWFEDQNLQTCLLANGELPGTLYLKI